jgi:hypothetical protein
MVVSLMRVFSAHGDITIGSGVLPMNRNELHLIGMDQTGAMHRFDALAERRLLKRRGKNITRSLQLRPARAPGRYNSFGRK